jgi:hypothetical protein
MVLTPLVRGLFGIEANAETKTLTVTPNLPADWDHAKVSHVPLGDDLVDLEFEKSGDKLIIRAHGEKAFSLGGDKPAVMHNSIIPLPAIELGLPSDAPLQGAMTSALKVTDEEFSGHSVTFVLSAPAKTVATLPVRSHRPHVAVDGASLNGNTLRVEFPDGNGYQERTVQFTW